MSVVKHYTKSISMGLKQAPLVGKSSFLRGSLIGGSTVLTTPKTTLLKVFWSSRPSLRTGMLAWMLTHCLPQATNSYRHTIFIYHYIIMEMTRVIN